MTGRTLLVGAASPIGLAISTELDRRGWSSVATSRRAMSPLRPLDVDDDQASRDVLADVAPTSIVYLATPARIGGGSDDSATIALASLCRFLERAAEAGTRKVVFASSAAVYGTGDRAARAEDSSLNPQDSYAELKIAAEDLLERSSARLGISAVALRLFNVYGPRLTSSLINRMFLSAAEPPNVFETAEYVRDYIHVTDVARAFAAALLMTAPGYAAVNVGTGVATDNLSLLAHPNALGTPVPAPAGFSSYSVADTGKMHTLLGFSPSVALTDALRSPAAFLR